MDFLEKMKMLAKSDLKTIVLPEGPEPRTMRATQAILEEGLAKIVLLGDVDEIKEAAQKQGVDITGAVLIDPQKHEKFEAYAENFYNMRKSKGVTLEQARETMKNTLYFGVMMIEMGDADGMVAGAINSTGNTLRPALQILKTAPGVKNVSSFMVVVVPNCTLGENGTFLFSDIGLNINPDADALAEIAIASAHSFESLVNAKPRVAMLSFSTYGSAKDESVTKMQEATRMAKERAPHLMIDGELQFDAAVIEEVGKLKAPGSPVAGQANVLIAPDLNTGNISYKVAQRLANADAYGPILQGIKKPVNDLSRGCSWEDIVGVVAITCVQAQNLKK